MGIIDSLFKGNKSNSLDETEDEEYLRRHRKLQGIILVYGPEGSGKTELLRLQLSLDVFRTYYVIVVGERKRYEGIDGIDAMIDRDEVESLSDLKKRINGFLKENKIRSAVIVFDDADDLAEKIGNGLWKYVNSMSRKHQIILASRDPPDGIRKPQMLVRLYEMGGNVTVYFYGKNRPAYNEYSWPQIRSNAIFMVALLE